MWQFYRLGNSPKNYFGLVELTLPQPRVFDELLSALDLSLRLQLRAEIKRIHDEFKFTEVSVTHDDGAR